MNFGSTENASPHQMIGHAVDGPTKIVQCLHIPDGTEKARYHVILVPKIKVRHIRLMEQHLGIPLPGNTMGFALNSGRIAGENAAEYINRESVLKLNN